MNLGILQNFERKIRSRFMGLNEDQTVILFSHQFYVPVKMLQAIEAMSDSLMVPFLASFHIPYLKIVSHTKKAFEKGLLNYLWYSLSSGYKLVFAAWLKFW